MGEKIRVHIDKYLWESETEKPAMKAIQILKEKKLAIEDDGALIVDLKKYNLGIYVLLTKQGVPTYEAKDLGLSLLKKELFNADTYVIFTGAEQVMHFNQLIKTLELMNFKKGSLIHKPYELVLKAGKKLNLVLDATRTQVQELRYEVDALNTIVVTAMNNGWQVKTNHIEPTATVRYTSATINGSIYKAGKQAGIPNKLMAQFVNVFSNRVSINKLRNGDKLALLYKEYTVGDKKVRDSEIVAAELIHKGKVDRIIGFTDPHTGTNFYTPDGHSIKPAFTRYPVNFKRIGDRFSLSRYHPILGIYRPHTGVDLAASTGTPIKATSNGRITFAGFKGGYGRAVIIKNGIYSTLCGHLSRFASNARSGKYVKQGEVIGYVGSSGLSNGPHVHYEFRVNGICYDPLKVKLPTGEMIPAAHRGRFLALSKQMLAQLDLHRKDDKVFAMYKDPSDSKFE
jgi:murein DD-endopeptidase MepM/ murein hydrolase activator NlpD